jgi:2-dehydro-3-deoxyphosphogluconate aldolase/(4S)-4-hydroxy-2-oxoglutarate aldolase
MKITEVLEQIQKYEIVPVASFSSVEDALKISEGLMNKNLPIIEITFRTGDAPLFIQSVKKEFSSMLVGAGSVVSVKMAKDAINAGADFIVMPGFNEDVVKFCKKKNVLCVPGVLTPTEITKAINLGCDILKLFPAEISGGVKYLKAVSAPFPKVKFIPTGGINEGNYKDYLEQKNVLAVGGSWPIDELKSK